MRWLFLMLLLTIPALGETFHVACDGSDSAAGDAAAPWKTIDRALRDPMVRGGDVILVQPGEYDGTLEISRRVFAGKPLILRGEPGAVLTGDGSAIIRVHRSRSVIIEGFTLRGSAACAVQVQDSSDITLRNLRMSEMETGVDVVNSSSVWIERCHLAGHVRGISVQGPGCIIRNNLITRCAETGVVVGGIRPAGDAWIRNNTFSENGASGDSPGAFWILNAPRVRVENNIVTAPAGRRLFTAESGEFSHNLYFSPNDRAGLIFGWQGVTEQGFSRLRLATADAHAMFGDPLLADHALHRSSPAIDAGMGAPDGLETDAAGNPRRAGLAVDIGAYEFQNPPGLHVEGNQILHQNRVVRLRGIGVGDPLLDRRERDFTDYVTLRETWNANTVRMSVHAYLWRQAEEFGGRQAVLDWYRHEIQAANQAGLYVILDWHVTGWPDGYAKPSEPGEPAGLHDSDFQLAADFWEAAAKEFGSNGLVAFELWNEPVRSAGDWKPDPTAWDQLRPYLETLTSIVRRHSENLVIVSGGSWAYGLVGIRKNPPSDPNTAIAWHVYAGKELNDEKRWAVALDELQRDFPVIVSEWGFDENGLPHYRGGISDFGEKFVRQWLQGRGLHWVAWCWHPTVGPSLIQSDWQSPTLFGAFVKYLLTANPPKALNPPRAISTTGAPVENQRPF